MAAQSISRQRYPTDLSNAEWQKIELLIPKPKTNRGRKRKHPVREILNAIFYLLRTGCVWRMLPHDSPPWKTVCHNFRLWRKDRVWEHIKPLYVPSFGKLMVGNRSPMLRSWIANQSKRPM